MLSCKPRAPQASIPAASLGPTLRWLCWWQMQSDVAQPPWQVAACLHLTAACTPRLCINTQGCFSSFTWSWFAASVGIIVLQVRKWQAHRHTACASRRSQAHTPHSANVEHAYNWHATPRRGRHCRKGTAVFEAHMLHHMCWDASPPAALLQHLLLHDALPLLGYCWAAA